MIPARQTRAIVREILRWILVVVLAVAVVGKLTEKPTVLSMPAWLRACAVAVEAVALMLLVFGMVKTGAAAVVVVAIGGIVFSLVHNGPDCGCLGSLITLSKAQHRLVASAFGFAGVAALMLCLPPRGSPDR